eukprot:gene29487-5834_t
MYSSLISYIKTFPKNEKVSVRCGECTDSAKVKTHLLNSLNKPELSDIARRMMMVPQAKTTKDELVDWILANYSRYVTGPLAVMAPLAPQTPLAPQAPQAFQTHQPQPVARVTQADLDDLRSLVAAFTAKLDALTL